MTRTRAIATFVSLLLLGNLAACGGDKGVKTCDEPQPYQAVVGGTRVVTPDDLDALDDLKEMPIPKSDTAPRPKGSKCIETPPSILTGGTNE